MAVSKEYLDNLVAELDQDKVDRFVAKLAQGIRDAQLIAEGACPKCVCHYCECEE